MKTRTIKWAALSVFLSLAGIAGATDFNPIPITNSFNADIIVEASATGLMRNATASTDGGTNADGDTWFEVGYDQDAVTVDNAYTNSSFLPGVPLHGTTFTGLQLTYDGAGGVAAPGATASPPGTYTYLMAPSYTEPNAVLIDTTVLTNYVTISTPAAYGALTFLVASGNGGSTVDYTIFHQDGTKESGTIQCSDWFGGANPAYIAYGRVATTTGDFDTQASIESPGNPRWYGRDISVTDAGSPITGIGFGYNSGAANVHNQIYAISGAATLTGPFKPVAFTGYNYDVIVEAEGTLAGRITTTTGVNTGAPATTETIDDTPASTTPNTDNTYFEKGYFPLQPLAGIPLQGSTVSNISGDFTHVFTMADDYTTNDVVYLANDGGWSNQPVNFATAATYSGLSFLYGAGSGGGTVLVQVNFKNGNTEFDSFDALDWFDNTSVFSYCNGRVEAANMTENNLNFPYATNGDPVLHTADVPLTDTNDPISSVNLLFTNTPPGGATVAIFAVSGSTGPIAPVLNGEITLTLPGSTNAQINADVGQTADFSIASPGGTAPVLIQWQADGGTGVFTNLSDGGNIAGAQTTNLTISDLTLAQNEYLQVVVSNSAGSITTTPIQLIVISPLTDVLGPSDTINFLPAPDAGSSPSGQGLANAIDQQVGSGDKYLNFGLGGGQPFIGPIGFVDQPALGPTFVTGVRLYCADDTAGPGGRDPADFELYGSGNGSDWTLLYQNFAVNMPVGRNAGAVGPLDPETNYLQQFLFSNSVSYSYYKWSVSNVQSDVNNNSMQIGEVELLGTQDTSGKPSVSIPSYLRAYEGSLAQITATVGGTPTPTVQWQTDGGTGVFSNLVDGGAFSGSATLTLSINPASSSNAFNFRAIATNTVGSATSSVVSLTILSSLQTVCSAGDATYTFGDNGLNSPNSANAGVDDSADAIDGLTTMYINNGSGPNASAGFVPFGGPAGFIVVPSAGTGTTPTSTVVQGIRIWPGQNSDDDDPADVELYGATTIQTNASAGDWQLIESSPLNLPTTRTVANTGLDPLNDPIQEIDFNNTAGYSSYKVQFTHTRDDALATSVQVAEVQLLGTVGAGVAAPRLSITSNVQGGTGTLTITSTGAGELQSATSLLGPWTDVETINGTVTINITSAQASMFYRIQ